MEQPLVLTPFERAVAAERLDECVSVVRGEYLNALGRDTILLEELVSERAFKSHVVKQAFDRIKSSGDGEQLYLRADGLAMHTTYSVRVDCCVDWVSRGLGSIDQHSTVNVDRRAVDE